VALDSGGELIDLRLETLDLVTMVTVGHSFAPMPGVV
jgi:hypothetical protein